MPGDSSVSTHIKIITAISGDWSTGTPFAIWELRNLSACSASSVVRTVNALVRMGYIKKSERGYRGRYYRVTHRWDGTEKVIEAFHYARMLKI